MNLQQIVTKLEAAGFDAEDLDDLVYQSLANRASSINNGGIEQQVEFLVNERGYDWEAFCVDLGIE